MCEKIDKKKKRFICSELLSFQFKLMFLWHVISVFIKLD